MSLDNPLRISFPNTAPYIWNENNIEDSYDEITSKLFKDYTKNIELTLNTHPFFNSYNPVSFEKILRKIQQDDTLLTFEEAFTVMTYVIGSVNSTVSDQVLHEKDLPFEDLISKFVLLYKKRLENHSITAEEIAGFAASILLLDTMSIDLPKKHIQMGGTGGDRGLIVDTKRLKLSFNASTCTMIALAANNIPVHKHHSVSYPTGIGGVEAFVNLGARRGMSDPKSHQLTFHNTKFAVSDYLSYHTSNRLMRRLRLKEKKLFDFMHAVGPLVTPSYKSDGVQFLGLSDEYNMHVIASALQLLYSHAIIPQPKGILFQGLDMDEVPSFDEVSPFKTRCLLIEGSRSREYLLDPSTILTPISKDSTQAISMLFLERDKANWGQQIENNRTIIFEPSRSPLTELVSLGSALATVIYNNSDRLLTISEEEISQLLKNEFENILQLFSIGEPRKIWKNYIQLTEQLL